MAVSALEKKQQVATAALGLLRDGMVLGVGTGSTVNALIDLLAPWRSRLRGAVSSSTASTTRLQALGIPVFDLNEMPELAIYIDGADEANPSRELIKGGGAALTREKIVAAAARSFVCIVDDSKLVTVLGRFPLPVEVIPMAREYVARQLTALGQTALACRGGHRQRQPHHRRAWLANLGAPCARGDDKPGRRRRYRWIVRGAAGRRTDRRHRHRHPLDLRHAPSV